MRGLVVAVVALVFAFQVVRTAAVQRAGPRSVVGAQLWPSHPAVMLDRTMASIGALARRGEPVPTAILGDVAAIAEQAPLAPEPFLINGAVAQVAGDQARAEQLFLASRARDPRSEAARYFLADRYLRSGRTEQALREMAAFSRLVPDGVSQLAPAIAAFAHSPGAIPQLRSFFQSSPEFEPLVLGELASEARNADLILALARSTGPPERWQPTIIDALIAQGQYGKAYSVWRKVAGVPAPAGGLFNPAFEDIAAPAPFNWTYSTKGGVAEPAGDGRLEVIYYGREDVVLAQQLLLLSAGRYRLSAGLSGQAGDGSAVAWSLNCLPQDQSIVLLPLKQGERTAAAEFTVPAGCPAQWLRLTGSAGEFPQSLDFTMDHLALAKVTGR